MAKVFDGERVALMEFPDRNLHYWPGDPPIAKNIYRIPLGILYVIEGIRARLAYEVAGRSEEEGFCDQLEPAFDGEGRSVGIALKPGVDKEDWFHIPVKTDYFFRIRLFDPPKHPNITYMRLPKSRAEEGMLDVACQVIYPLWYSKDYAKFYVKWGIETPHRLQMRDMMRSALAGMDPFWNFPSTQGDINLADGQVKIAKLRTNPGYRNLAKIFSRLQMEGVIDDFEFMRDMVLSDFEKGSDYARRKGIPLPPSGLQKPEETFDDIRELFKQYQKEMAVESVS